jgi:carboxypeptidase family protein
VTGPDGKPLADAWVSVHQDIMSMLDEQAPGPNEGAQMRSITVDSSGDEGGSLVGTEVPPALTDAQGHYEIRGLSHGAYDVVAEAQKGKLRGRANHITPDATANIQALGVATLAGTVHGAKGPAALFTVELAGPTRATRTFTDGAFSFGRVDPGAYTVRVSSADGNGTATVTVAPDEPTTVDIPLTENAVLIGKLVDDKGQPVAGIGVTLVPQAADGRVEVRLDGPPPVSGADGSFRIEHEAGTLMFVAMTPPHPTIKGGVILTAGKTVDLGPITVSVGAPPGGPSPGGPQQQPPPSPRIGQASPAHPPHGAGVAQAGRAPM